MKPSLQLKIGQHLTMTPQLQQAIKLLQLSSLDLQAEIQEALDTNPLLDQDETQESFDTSETPTEFQNTQEDVELETTEAVRNEQIEKELPVDTQWEDLQYTAPISGQRLDDESLFEVQGATTDSLSQHLLWQLELKPLSELDKAIGTIIIDSIDEEGYLRTSLDDLVTLLNSSQELDYNEEPIEPDEIQAVIHLIQSFDPIGVCATDLRECLLLQLKHFPEDTELLRETRVLVEQHFDSLASKNYKRIMQVMKLSESSLKKVVHLIQSLNPRPGNIIASSQPEYIVPDVFVSKKKGKWTVELNPDSSPKLKINSNYASLIKRADSGSDNVFLKNNLQEAKWFIKSLMSRNETLLKVASRIVERQINFFEYGEEAMKPLVLHDIAEEVEMHESTVSRVTTQKYIHTPRGIFELKYFFSSHVNTHSGGECSSTAIRALLKKLVANENQAKPLSDNKIASLLKEQGINVARRTIAKYREAMNIPPSNERKSLI